MISSRNIFQSIMCELSVNNAKKTNISFFKETSSKKGSKLGENVIIFLDQVLWLSILAFNRVKILV